MCLKARKVLDVGKIVGTQVRERSREVFYLKMLPRVKIVQCLWHMSEIWVKITGEVVLNPCGKIFLRN